MIGDTPDGAYVEVKLKDGAAVHVTSIIYTGFRHVIFSGNSANRPTIVFDAYDKAGDGVSWYYCIDPRGGTIGFVSVDILGGPPAIAGGAWHSQAAMISANGNANHPLAVRFASVTINNAEATRVCLPYHPPPGLC